MKKVTAMMLMLAAVCSVLFWAQADTERDTPEIEGVFCSTFAGEDITAGTLAGIWTNGLAYAAQDSKVLVAPGRVGKSALAGERVTLKRRGVFLWDATTKIDAADIGKTVYMVSNDTGTVSLSPGSVSNVVGTVWWITGGSNAWVRCGL